MKPFLHPVLASNHRQFRKAATVGKRVCLLALGLCLPWAVWAQDGVFADFVTSQGAFTCQLDHERCPQAVANFMALAEGARSWLEEESGRVVTRPFYDGLTFHRVIAGFMIQGGSPNGRGTDGPGYVFRDSFDPALRHSGSGVLSMANSGPNSNGSQFFITVAAAPWLDDVHTVFGRVVAGYAVVQSISELAVDEANRPQETVRIESVRIRRVGAAADAFDPQTQGLPKVSTVALGIRRDTDGWSLWYDQPAFAEIRLRQSPDLRQWTSSGLGIELGSGGRRSVVVDGEAPTRFFALTQVQYPSSTYAPQSLEGGLLALGLDGEAGVLEFTFHEAGRGLYQFRGGDGTVDEGTVTDARWVQEVYRGRLVVETSGLFPMSFRLDFSGTTGGRFFGTVHAPQPFTISGMFRWI